MLKPLTLMCIACTSLLTSGIAAADHNSKWGEGWANMPNDIHNTRIETRGDNSSFRDFVRYGNGADSENRFERDSRRQGTAMSRSTHQSRSSMGPSNRARGSTGGRR